MDGIGIPYAQTDPETGERVCPVCDARFAEDHDTAGELVSDNYGDHYRQWHAAMTDNPDDMPSPQADVLHRLMDAVEELGLFGATGSVTDGMTATVTVTDDLTGRYVITCTPA